jgi:large subunit ribosomal protein L31e
MVRRSMKYSVVGKEAKQGRALEASKASAARAAKDNKRWKRVLAKMSPERKASYTGVGNTAGKNRVRGVTRRSTAERKGRKDDNTSYELTIHLAKLIKGRKFAKRAPMAVDKIRAFAKKLMKTKDNRIDGSLNTYIWHQGVKGVPTRVRVRIERHVAESTDGASKRKRLYTVISHVPVPTFKGLLTKPITA